MASTTETSPLPQTFEACWLDGHISENGQHQQLKDWFSGLSKLIKWHFFDTKDKLHEYLQINSDKKLIAIMSGKFARTELAMVSGNKTLHSAYVFTIDIDRNRQALGDEPKLRGIFNTEEAVYNKLKEDLVQVFSNEGTRLALANLNNEAKIYFDEAKRLSSN